MFHLRDNFYFERAGDRVLILYKKDGVVSATLVTRSEFASAVAAVSERGETGETHAEALAFLERLDIPRRADIQRNVPAELAIRNAMLMVENLPADERLTKAVTLLGDAREAVADYIDGKIQPKNPPGSE